MSEANPKHPATCACSQCEHGRFLIAWQAQEHRRAEVTRAVKRILAGSAPTPETQP